MTPTPFEERLREELSSLADGFAEAPTVDRLRQRQRRRVIQRGSWAAMFLLGLTAGFVWLNRGPGLSDVSPLEPSLQLPTEIAIVPERTVPVPSLPESPSSGDVLEAMSVYLASVGITEGRVVKDPHHGISFSLEGEPRCGRVHLDEGLSGLLAHCRRATITVSARPEDRGILVILN